MRTTIEMNPEHRARLLELAARRGEKGFSGVVNEAIETYLARQQDQEARQRKALELNGALSPDDGDALRTEIRRLRESWDDRR
jgi:predicted transcriptional regulator